MVEASSRFWSYCRLKRKILNVHATSRIRKRDMDEGCRAYEEKIATG